jgi:hypothetical protein
VARRKSLRREPVGEERVVFRVVRADSLDAEVLAHELVSDREAGKQPITDREHKYPELLDGISVRSSLDKARERWRDMRKNADHLGEAELEQGNYIAELVLVPGQGFDIEDRGKPDGKLTIWGEPAKLALAVRRIVQADGNIE